MAVLVGALAYVALARKTGRARPRDAAATLSLAEAYLILGLSTGARRDDVLAAYRNLMKRLHPDQGGTSYLASRVIEAKDLLLKHVKV